MQRKSKETTVFEISEKETNLIWSFYALLEKGNQVMTKENILVVYRGKATQLVVEKKSDKNFEDGWKTHYWEF